ncbi:MAG: hypothetical protein RLZZ447_355 [Verrucomicrobiota bacterium]|jgi:CheY-like chemotaxis protein
MALKPELSRWFAEGRLDALGAAVLALLGLVRGVTLVPRTASPLSWRRKLGLAGSLLLVGTLLAAVVTWLWDLERGASFASRLTDRVLVISGIAAAGLLLSFGPGQLAVRFRRARRSDPPATAVKAHPEPRGPRVLVVDDLETNRLLLHLFLRRHGFQTEFADGGEAAIRRAARGDLDVILMDLHMPQPDGFAATRRIRQAELPGRRIPIVALTASLARGTREQCLAAGMDEQLTKPLEIERLRALLIRFLPDQRH